MNNNFNNIFSQSNLKGRPSVVPVANFNAVNDASTLRTAMKGLGTNEKSLINVLCRRSSYQRLEISKAFKTAYGKDLVDDIKSETSGNFQKLLIALLTPPLEFYAKELSNAIAGKNENVLIEVLCTRTNYEINLIKATYQRVYGKSLDNELHSSTSGNFNRLMTSLSCGGRDETMVINEAQAKTDALELKKAGIGKWGTDESVFNRILCQRNHGQIKLIAQEYQKLTQHTLEKDIKSEFSGSIEQGLLAIIKTAHNLADFFAFGLYKSMAGLGTNDRALIRLVVTRCEVDMEDIKAEFEKSYKKTLKSFIQGDTSGYYRDALYALIGEHS